MVWLILLEVHLTRGDIFDTVDVLGAHSGTSDLNGFINLHRAWSKKFRTKNQCQKHKPLSAILIFPFYTHQERLLMFLQYNKCSMSQNQLKHSYICDSVADLLNWLWLGTGKDALNIFHPHLGFRGLNVLLWLSGRASISKIFYYFIIHHKGSTFRLVFPDRTLPQLWCPQLSSYCDPNDGPWRWTDMCHFNTIPLVIYFVSRTANPDPDRLLGISSLKEKYLVHPVTTPWCLVDTEGEQRKWELRGRGEVSMLGQRNLLALKLWRGWWRKGFSEWVLEMCISHLKEKAELLQPCIHGNHLRTNSSPCWGLLFLQRKWLKEVKVRKLRTEDETSHVDFICYTSKKPSNCKYQWAMSDYLAKYQSPFLRALSRTPDAETEWHLEAETLMSWDHYANCLT